MRYWINLVADVKRNKQSRNFLLSKENFETAGNPFFFEEKKLRGFKVKRDLRAYYLGEPFGDLYLTKREAECVFWLVQTHTIAQAAAKMCLSPRTIEFYIKNLKKKLKCKNKKILLDTLLQTDLFQQLEQDGLRLTKH